MATLLILTLICAVLLALTGSMPIWLSAVIVAACLAGLGILARIRQKQQHLLSRRCHYHQACWGIPVRHLGGLPLPLDTPGNLFLLPDRLLLENEHDQLVIRLPDLRQMLLTTAEQIRKVSDRQLCRQLPDIFLPA